MAQPELKENTNDVFIFQIFSEILSIKQNLENVKSSMNKSIDDAIWEEHNMLEDMIDSRNWELGNLVGYDTLAVMRRMWGMEEIKYNKLQEKFYKLQKERYEQCKRVKRYFTDEDHKFIQDNKTLCEQAKLAETLCGEYRDTIADIIDSAFPNSTYDDGWDEVQ